MTHRCTTVEQGYPSITHHMDCLSHTGTSLTMFAVWGACLIIASLVLLGMARWWSR